MKQTAGKRYLEIRPNLIKLVRELRQLLSALLRLAVATSLLLGQAGLPAALALPEAPAAAERLHAAERLAAAEAGSLGAWAPAAQADTETPTDTPSFTPSETPTSSDTPTASSTPTASNTATFTASPTPTAVKLAEWKFEGGSGVDTAPGSVVDTGGVSGAVVSPGVLGQALSFDGVDDYFNVGSSVDLRPAGSFALSAWIYPTAAGGGARRTILMKSDVLDYVLRLDANGYIEFVMNDLPQQKINGAIPTLNTWTYVVATYSESEDQIKLFVNGVLVAAQSFTGSVTYDNGALRIGSTLSGADVWKGSLDEVTIYNRALTAAEITALYSGQPTPTPTPIGTATYTPTASLTPTITSTPTITLTPSLTPTLPPFDEWGSGMDGNVTISGGTVNIHTTNLIAGRSCANGGDAVSYSVISLGTNTATLSSAPSGGCLNVGDEIMLANLQARPGTYANFGNFEFLRVLSVSGTTVTFYTSKQNFYGSDPGSDANIGTGAGNQHVILQRVPNYNNLVVNGYLVGSAWDGVRYGMIAFRVAGTLSGSGSINMNVRGFRGGRGGWRDAPRQELAYAEQGESYIGLGGVSSANNAGGGGGGTALYGAGGGYGSLGGSAGGNVGGTAYGNAALTRLGLGSGGGGGNYSCSPCSGGYGGQGGGGMAVFAETISFAGIIQARGDDGTCGPGNSSQGAGGAGGMIRIYGDTVSLSGAVYATGGSGCASAGDGGAGRIAIYYATSLSSGTISPSAYTFNTSSTPTPTPTPGPAGPWGNGADGNLVVLGTVNINTTNNILGRSCADGGDAVAYSVVSLGNSSATLSQAPAIGCLNPGDEVLLANMQGISGAYANTGNYEFLRVASLNGGLVTFTQIRQGHYGNVAGFDNGIGIGSNNQKVMLIRVPNYENVNVNGTLTGSAWNGLKFGLILFRVHGDLTGAGNIYGTALGYRGGRGGWWDNVRSELYYAEQGESYIGLGGVSAANNAGGGGGATGLQGAGGGYKDPGGSAGSNVGGTAYGDAPLSRLMLGSGGGGGSYTCTPCSGGYGGAGGMGIYIFADEFDFDGAISAQGASGTCGPGNSSQGGGGAGGFIRLVGNTVSIGNASAIGGQGCASAGDGGNGRIAVYYASGYSHGAVSPAAFESSSQSTPTPTATLGAPSPWGSGADGDLIISTTFNIHSQNSTVGRSCANGGDAVAYSVMELTETSARLSQIPAPGCLAVGDEVLLINLQGTQSNNTNSGNYEIFHIAAVAGDVVVFSSGKSLEYGDNGSDANLGTGAGNQRVMLMRVPNYEDVTISGTLYGSAWDGVKFGVLAFRVSGILSGAGNIIMSERGFRGGNGGWWDNVRQEQRNALQGESYSGLGVSSASNNAGGGGGNTSVNGAGGGYGGAGVSAGGNQGGAIHGDAPLLRANLGSGGGGSIYLCSPCSGGYGGNGGGVMFIFAETTSYSGSMQAVGEAGECVLPTNNTRSGGGSGGAIRLQGDTITLSGSVSAAGGAGCAGSGAGGAGRIAIYADSLSYSSVNPAPYAPGATQTPTPSASPSPTPTPTPQISWELSSYSYQSGHAVTGVEAAP